MRKLGASVVGGLAVVGSLACEDDPTSPVVVGPDASFALDASTSDSSPGLAPGDGGASGCAEGETPTASMRTAAVFIPGGWSLWGYLSGGKEEAETQTCELAKGLYITPVFNAATTPTDAEIDATACAMQRGAQLPVGDLGYNDPSCGSLPCSGATFYLVMDPDGQHGEITTVLAGGKKQRFAGVWIKGDKLLIADGGSAGALYTKASGNAFSCFSAGGGS